MSSRFTLTVSVDSDSERKLKAGGYNLCICKRVGDDAYNVIWSGKEFLASNTFRWVESYAVFGTQVFEDGALAEAATAIRNIGFNQSCLLASDCILEAATGAVRPTGIFRVINDCKADMHIGVMQALGNDDTKKVPIYLSKVTVKGQSELEPRNQVLVFFDRKLESQMMFERDVSRATEIDFPGGTVFRDAFYNADEEWEVDGVRRPRLAYHPTKGFYPDRTRFL